MNLARIIVLVVALGAGVGAAYLALNLINQEPQTPTAPTTAVATPTPQPTIQTTEVLVAAADIPLGSRLEPSQMVWRAWPSSGLSQTYIRRPRKPEAIAEFTGLVARSAFLAGEPITEAKLVSTNGGLMSAMLPAGMRAIAVSVSAVTTAGGFILPNDRVDVIMTRKDPTDNARYFTETILRNIRVLAIDQALREQDGEMVVVGQTATLELTPQQAEIITVATQISDRLALALRSLADANEQFGPETDAVHLLTGEEGGVTIVRNGVSREAAQ